MGPRAIGFIGLGTMGFPMAKNLSDKLPAGAKLYVFDVVKDAMEKLEAATPSGRVVSCKTAAEVADLVDVLIVIVPEGKHARAVFLDEKTGVITANISNKMLIDCSTIDTETSRHIAAEIHRKDTSALFYDAPISGGSLGAENGSLTFMVGCSENNPDWQPLERLLKLMGKSVFSCGSQSMGLVAKLANNYCSGLIAIATSEAMIVAMKSGMDPRVLVKIFSTSTAQSTICDKWCPVPGVVPEAPSSNGYKGGFKVQLMKKDFSLAVDAARELGIALHLGEAGLNTYKEASEDPRCRDLDSRVIYRYLGGNEDWSKSV
ncbi:NAD binding domain of 6-phosphogluconate dehydrogenase-domain-containing protein [Xylariales sp. AK1849]|nr:NAD binding domain of 6-phosphogluconate dehydrogenase-domain-containing protein [Xylariales sp. AK1849]